MFIYLKRLVLAFLLSARIADPGVELQLPSNFATVVVLNTKGGGGSACPVGVGAFAYTAKHVTQPAEDYTTPTFWIDPLDRDRKQYPLRVIYEDKKLDLAKVAPAGNGVFFPHPRRIASHPPYAGEEVEVYGIYEDRPAVYKGGHVLNLDSAGRLVVDGSAFYGTSGGCICSLKTGEVYAIFVSFNEVEGTRPFLLGIPIWGR